jgi:hypothetical protein
VSPLSIGIHEITSIEVGETMRIDGDGRPFWSRQITFRCDGGTQTIELFAHTPTGLMMPHEQPAGLTDADREDAAERCARG